MTDQGPSKWNDDSAMPRCNQEVTVGMEAGDATRAVGPAGEPIEKQTSLAFEAFRELRRSPIFVVSAGLVLVMIFIAIFPQLLAPVKPIFQACHLKDARKPPQAGAPFGYDNQGCDVFDAVIWGARPSIAIGLLVTVGILVIGVFFGSL